MSDKVSECVLLPALALVEDYNHLHAPRLGIDQSLGNGFTGEYTYMRISDFAT